ncbi:MAG: hypothetical protein NC201_02765 [Prevotella sp.]|nr:hypothetical protein [Bacteroides sp.]MCM1366147.1 hypothetical protein [Prevotella sp.]MCM1436788.1 hypothetical protein [Prevotella sp.]
MKSTKKIIPVILLIFGIFSLMTLKANACELLQLCLEAQIEDGNEAVWKFYLYGNINDNSGEMTCTYGSKKYEGTWTASTTPNNKTAYIFTFPETETPQFTIQNGTTIPIHSSAIVMSSRDDADFVIDINNGQCSPFGAADNGNATRQTFYCEIYD